MVTDDILLTLRRVQKAGGYTSLAGAAADEIERLRAHFSSSAGGRPVVTIYVPNGYADANEFLKDCGFEAVEPNLIAS